jgi:dTDP-4-amino-4,6-dideoxygalactose transaminase
MFADIDRDSQNISAESIRKALSPKTKAIIAVHLAGWPCDMDAILELALRYDLKVIEDCAQPTGRSIKEGRWVLRPRRGIFLLSDKIMTTGGEGGMLLTGDEDLWATAGHSRITARVTKASIVNSTLRDSAGSTTVSGQTGA